VQQLAGAALHLHLVEDAEPVDFPAEEEIADDIEVAAHREVLVDGRDPQDLGVLWTLDLDGTALPLDDAPVGGTDPRDHLDQGGLAGGVVAHQGDHLPGPDLQLDVHQRLDGSEALGDAAQRQQGLNRHGPPPSTFEEGSSGKLIGKAHRQGSSGRFIG
jgi:hypothetical protein